MNNQELQKQVNSLQSQLNDLTAAFYKNNFSERQDFNKSSNFTTKLKTPHYDTLPTTCEVGDIAESSGKLNICSAANTWTVVGTQT